VYYFGGGFAVVDEFLETGEMAVDTLTVGGPGGVLEVAGDGREGDAVGVLQKGCKPLISRKNEGSW